MARVGVDLDGVLYDFPGSMRAFLTEGLYDRPEDLFPEPTRWEFYEDWGYSQDEFHQLVLQGCTAGVVFTHGDPYPGTVEALRRLVDAGHTIHIVTHRPAYAHTATKEWLWAHDIPYDTLTFSGDKTSVPTDYFIDDKPENYHALVPTTTRVMLMGRPWNQGVAARRAESMDHFVDAVLGNEELDKMHDGEVRVTSSTGGQKGTKPARFDLLPPRALTTVAELYGKGAEKYDDHNWRKGYDWSLSFAAMMRHAWAFWGGEDIDPETGLPHMASVAFHALGLLEFMVEQPEFDDRFKPAT